MQKLAGLAATMIVAAAAAAGPYSAATGNPTTPNPHDAPIPGYVGPDGDGRCGGWAPDNVVNPAFVGWASRVVHYAPSDPNLVGLDPSPALGPVTGDRSDVVSLGELDPNNDPDPEPGRITLAFERPIRNGDGPDLAVFENGFYDTFNYDGGFFGELAFVEVSSDGDTYARFPAVSLTETPVPAIGSIDETDVYNLAGKHANAYGYTWGTPFDLEELSDEPAVATGHVNLQAIRYVRLVDIAGDGRFVDSYGHEIYDPWITEATAGFDLEAVGVLHALPLGDMNADGALTIDDLQPMLIAIADEAQYTDITGLAPADAGDFDDSGDCGIDDLQPFLLTLADGSAVPEPTVITVVALGFGLLLRRRRP